MKAYHSCSDKELLSLLKAGDQTAFAEIYDRYWTLLYAHAYKMIRNQEDAKDLIQDAFSMVWLKAETLTEDANIAGYLYTAVRNKVFNLIGQQKVRNDYFSSIARFADEFSLATLDQIHETDLMHAIEKEIQKLPPKMREIFELSRKYDLSHREIAEKLNLSEQTVKKQVQNALKVLKPRIKDLGASLAILLLLH